MQKQILLKLLWVPYHKRAFKLGVVVKILGNEQKCDLLEAIFCLGSFGIKGEIFGKFDKFS